MDTPYGRSGRHALRHTILVCLGAFLLAPVFAAGAPSKAANPECLGIWGEVRYRGFGYDHIVHVSNRCAQTAICDVSSDVNPTPQRVIVPVGQEVEVLTFRGSPSREFVPRVDCRLGPPS
jgi:hypothetical protein